MNNYEIIIQLKLSAYVTYSNTHFNTNYFDDFINNNNMTNKLKARLYLIH